MKDTTLFDRIESFNFPASYFKRLCRENGWTKAQGQGVIEEYRRFLYLATVSAEPVTPPEAVDQAWHLHLIYTKSYWEDLCVEVLGRPLHHGPTAGGHGEDEKFEDWYERTKRFYAEEFGEAPPAGIWPSSAVRFDPQQRFRWLDVSRCWIIPKPKWQLVLPSVMPFLLISGAASIVLVMGLAVLGILGVVLYNGARATGDGRKKSGESGGGDISVDGSSSSDCGDSGGGGDCGGGSGCGGGGCGGGGD